ncbi:hypothetical protein QFC22_002946 [Naganishia vaughanmartiniae]|uniref:Uncharacterized protein n=1 Tax=Naganishia vaughanmartiniae TaxID=1424756 RepID=A0ACC2X9G8_9TREE|nr:hypothetical protein QFC22_002946 [Naganishia vaughanmartiniae]
MQSTSSSAQPTVCDDRHIVSRKAAWLWLVRFMAPMGYFESLLTIAPLLNNKFSADTLPTSAAIEELWNSISSFCLEDELLGSSHFAKEILLSMLQWVWTTLEGKRYQNKITELMTTFHDYSLAIMMSGNKWLTVGPEEWTPYPAVKLVQPFREFFLDFDPRSLPPDEHTAFVLSGKGDGNDSEQSSDDDEDLQRAIQLSLGSGQSQSGSASGASMDQYDHDSDLKAAIALSLAPNSPGSGVQGQLHPQGTPDESFEGKGKRKSEVMKKEPVAPVADLDSGDDSDADLRAAIVMSLRSDPDINSVVQTIAGPSDASLQTGEQNRPTSPSVHTVNDREGRNTPSVASNAKTTPSSSGPSE